MRVNLQGFRKAVNLAARLAPQKASMKAVECFLLAPDPTSPNHVIVSVTDLDMWAEFKVAASDVDFSILLPVHFFKELLNLLEGDVVDLAYDLKTESVTVTQGRNVNVLRGLATHKFPAFPAFTWNGIDPIHADDLALYKEQLLPVPKKKSHEDLAKLVALGETSLATDLTMIAYASRSSVYNLRLPATGMALAAAMFAGSEEIAVALSQDGTAIRYTDMTNTLCCNLVDVDIPKRLYEFGLLTYANEVKVETEKLTRAVKAALTMECTLLKVTADPGAGIEIEGIQIVMGKFHTMLTATLAETDQICPRFEFYVSPEKLATALSGLKAATRVALRYDEKHVPMSVAQDQPGGAFYVIARMKPTGGEQQ